MVVDHLHLSEDSLQSETILRIPLLEISGLYNTSVYLNHYDIDIYGNGSFKWQISDFKLKMNLSLTRNMKTECMQLQKVNIDQSMNGSKFEIKNLLNDETVSNTISDVVSIVIPPLHNYFKPVINELVVRLVALNSEVLFSNIKYDQFVSIIHAFADKAKSNNSL